MGRFARLRRGSDTASEREFVLADGEHVFHEGDAAGPMFVVAYGSIEIARHHASGLKVIARLGPGEFFGEMSLLESEPRFADARAIGPTGLLVVDEATLLTRLRRDPTLAVEMLHALSGRLRRATGGGS